MPTTYRSNRKKVDSEIERVIRLQAESAADEYLRILQELFRASKSGRIYRVGKTPTKADRAAKRRFRSHKASAPGEAPARDTGALAKGSARTAAQKLSPMRWRVIAGVTVQSGRSSIAEWLERGTRRMAARPGWRMALEILRSRRSNLAR